jgi:hypothetical protein
MVKTRLQLQGEFGGLKGGAKPRGAFGTAAGILREEGMQVRRFQYLLLSIYDCVVQQPFQVLTLST